MRITELRVDHHHGLGIYDCDIIWEPLTVEEAEAQSYDPPEWMVQVLKVLLDARKIAGYSVEVDKVGRKVTFSSRFLAVIIGKALHRAWEDEEFRARLCADPGGMIDLMEALDQDEEDALG